MMIYSVKESGGSKLYLVRCNNINELNGKYAKFREELFDGSNFPFPKSVPNIYFGSGQISRILGLRFNDEPIDVEFDLKNNSFAVTVEKNSRLDIRVNSLLRDINNKK